ncbi:MAG: glutamate 5-kinase, partial [Bdellovibrionota bacterium]
GPLLIRAWMTQVAELKRKHGIEIIWVTSGAIAAAAERTGFHAPRGRTRTLPEKQALSALGQPMIMETYLLALGAAGLIGAQVLLTASDIDHAGRRRNLQNTLKTLLGWNAVPVLNENDAVATEEIQFGDNDSLSSKIARMMKAERLVLLTDVDGLFDADPKKNPNARLIPYRASISTKDLALAGKKAGSMRGTGGMHSKLMAAQLASRAKITTHLVRGDWPNNLTLLAEGAALGTQVGGRMR